MKYYLVTAKCGHVGRDKYIPIDFPIQAENGKDAARYARNIRRVKHDHKDAILRVVEVSQEKYEEQMIINSYDPYLNVKSKYQQNNFKDEIMQRTLFDSHSIKKIYRRKRDSVEYRLKKYALLNAF